MANSSGLDSPVDGLGRAFDPRPPLKRPKTLAGIVIAAATAIAAPQLAEPFEGYSPVVYLDPAKIPTYCFGETANAGQMHGRRFSRDDCSVLLRARMARDYAAPVLQCLPQLADERFVYVFAAMTDAAYNAGPARACRSPMAARIRAGDWRGACDRFPTWYVSATYHGSPLAAAIMRARGWRWTGAKWVKTLPGLERRRRAERTICLTNLPS